MPRPPASEPRDRPLRRAQRRGTGVPEPGEKRQISRVPPTSAPSRFAPNAAVGSAGVPERSAKIRFATKIGENAIATAASDRDDREAEQRRRLGRARRRRARGTGARGGVSGARSGSSARPRWRAGRIAGHRAEDERVHEPRGPEEQCELYDALRLEEEERGAHEEEVGVAEHRAERPLPRCGSNLRMREHERERHEVPRRDRTVPEGRGTAVVDGRRDDRAISRDPIARSQRRTVGSLLATNTLRRPTSPPLLSPRSSTVVRRKPP